MVYPSGITGDVLRARIAAARQAKAAPRGEMLTVEAFDAIFGTDGEMAPRRPRPKQGRKRCPRCKKYLARCRFYFYANNRGSTWCKECQSSKNRLKKPRVLAREGRTP